MVSSIYWQSICTFTWWGVLCTQPYGLSFAYGSAKTGIPRFLYLELMKKQGWIGPVHNFFCTFICRSMSKCVILAWMQYIMCKILVTMFYFSPVV